MSQDLGPTQEPQVSGIDLALQAHNFDDLISGANGLDGYTSIAYAGMELESLIKKWKGKQDSWSELKGKKVLDLASGSALNPPDWRPYFARICANNGASVTAVDIISQAGSDKSLLHGVTTDLVSAVMTGRLGQVVEGVNFDVIHSSSFIGANPSPELQERLERFRIKEGDFRQALLDQSLSFLSEGGIISFDERDFANRKQIYYTKKEGKLTQL